MLEQLNNTAHLAGLDAGQIQYVGRHRHLELARTREPEQDLTRARRLGAEDHAATSRHITLVVGGARSGMSAWAEHLARDSRRQVLYVATATAGDDEMAARSAAHRARRSSAWRTVEETLRLVEAIQTNASPDNAVVVDCLTLWARNVLVQGIGPDTDAEAVTEPRWAAIEAAMLHRAHPRTRPPAVADPRLE